MPLIYTFLLAAIILSSCNAPDTVKVAPSLTGGKYLASEAMDTGKPDTGIQVGATTPAELITFARTLKGVPYKYGSTDPAQGFDCSGFITYVFNHFKIVVPRTSAGFTNIRREVPLRNAQPGDLILFTGTDSTKREVGHMGILVTKATEGPVFIHSTSGKANGVTETPLNSYYQGRFVKTIRIFGSNDEH
ncbi:C40 family peptidase [Mucilaginibacter daejeonensis]|uniref:C40 family peptidase n=1 Tax=Mucilaginibacter daejeonensis TaxID=398049 RepID=UPI001D17D076|nr:C40 family peptidase [Mucilaginibacter daejeonensis]UEG53743.1 C40 family peptidase [Mucilaginibacter daejeonensis]